MITIKVRDFDEWRERSRELLQRRVYPDWINWGGAKQGLLEFDDPDQNYLDRPIVLERPGMTPAFFDLAKSASYYRDPGRWALMYSLAWRLLFEDKRVLGNSIDEQVMQLNAMRKAVSRDIHKMKAFVRFKSVEPVDADSNEDQAEHFIAWFEPEHLIVPAAAPFFIKRFSNMNWSILTPDLCAHWNQKQLIFSEGAAKSDHQDELESLWLEYYKNIFNPARLKISAMQSEMPQKYWHNLPEAALINEMIRDAHKRMHGMFDQAYSAADGKLSKSKFVQKNQQGLRAKRLKSNR